jgi:hypothetical protein
MVKIKKAHYDITSGLKLLLGAVRRDREDAISRSSLSKAHIRCFMYRLVNNAVSFCVYLMSFQIDVIEVRAEKSALQ